jgi:hypothetical protein
VILIDCNNSGKVVNTTRDGGMGIADIFSQKKVTMNLLSFPHLFGELLGLGLITICSGDACYVV